MAKRSPALFRWWFNHRLSPLRSAVVCWLAEICPWGRQAETPDDGFGLGFRWWWLFVARGRAISTGTGASRRFL